MFNLKANAVYHYYNQVLKTSDISRSLIVKGVSSRFGLREECITIKKVGTHVKFDALVIETELQKIVVPLKSKEEILFENGVEKSFGDELIEKHQITLPPFVPRKYLTGLLETKGEEVVSILREVYDESFFAMQLEGTYTKIQSFKSSLNLIQEAVECLFLKKYAGTISILLIVIEAITREFGKEKRIVFNEKGSTSAFTNIMKAQKNTFVQEIYLKRVGELPSECLEEKFLKRVDEAMDLLTSYENYGLEYLYKSDSDFKLNRHSIFHGLNLDFYNEVNCYRLFSCLDALAFAITFDPFTYNAEKISAEGRKVLKFRGLKKVGDFISKAN